MNEVLVIVPTYNEVDNVGPLSEAVCAACPTADLLFVDDNSPDGTGDRIEQIRLANPRVHVLHRNEKAGLGRAYVAGFQWALERSYTCICEMDADFSHRPADLPLLLEAAHHADVALGSRYLGGVRVVNWPLKRLLISKGAAIYVRLITGMPVYDPTAGFKCYRRAVLENIDIESLRSNGYSFQIETIHRAWRRGFTVREVPITFEDRRVGVSKMSAAIMTEALSMVWRLLIRGGCRRCAGRRHPQSVGTG